MTSNTPNAAAAESAIRRIGTEFGRLRSLRGERLEDIAGYLDIKATYLFGIEQGDLSVIPTKRDAKAMVRSYANYLGLDGEAIAGPMDPIIASLRGDKAPSEPVKPRRADRTSVAILATAAVLGVLVGWSWIGDVEQFDLIAPPLTADTAVAVEKDILEEPGEADAVADAAAGLAEAEVDEGSAGPDDPAGGGGLIATIDEEDLSSEAAQAADALLAELKSAIADDAEVPADAATTAAGNTQQVAAAPTQPKKEELPVNVLATLVAARGDGAHIYEAENTDARVIVRALTDVSVQVVSRSRDYVWTQTMKPREMLLVPNRDDLELWTGNAAGIEVLLDGKILPQLGPSGTVISGLSLTAASLEAISEVVPETGAKPTF